MLIPCPECARQVSDRAKACPDCGFPVSEHVAEQRELARRQALLDSRERIGEIDCPRCEARGFVNFSETDEDGVTQQVFAWCSDCKHSGRVHQCRDLDGYYAVSYAALEGFLRGALEREAEGVVFVGTDLVAAHRYVQAGKIWDPEAEE
jgi:hypothetical protein